MCSHTCWNGSPSLHTEEQRAGSWHQKRKRRKFSSLSVRNESSFHPQLRKSFWLDLNQSKIYLRLGIFASETLFRISGHKELCIQTVVWNNQNPQFPELAAQVLECSFSFSPKLRWERQWQLSSETTLPRPMWSCEEMAIQWLEFTHGMNHSQHEMTSLQSGTNS